MPGGQARGVLAFQGIRQVQALALFMGVEHHQADVGPAVEVGHAQDLSALKYKREVAAARQDLFT
ncbi:hypothetical protein D3C76_1821150 [compost metagenome]